MQLSQLTIRDFRNLRNVKIDPSPGINLIFGKNASGKTSILESIYYLSHLRSFRTPYLTDIINNEASCLQLFARAEHQQKQSIPIGIKRSRQKLEVRANQKTIKRVADITSLLPVLAIHPDSYRLITGSPTERRQYLDWGVFHVEHGFFDAWQRYKKALTQRNTALRSGQDKKYCQLWDAELDQSATIIDQLRQRYFQNLAPYMNQLVTAFFPGQDIRVEYKRGWKENETLRENLRQNYDKDKKRGLTQAGPHRADIHISVDGKSAQTGISRGQQKTLVALLKLAQVQQFTATDIRHCILLYDDLAAELDDEHRQQILKVLEQMPIQLFLTAIEAEQIDTSHWKERNMFHVKQGVVEAI
jgi:DNA replication and repair protein RecF